jgi:hypothetical protein
MESPNTGALVPLLRVRGLSERGVERVFSTFNVDAEPFKEAAGRG